MTFSILIPTWNNQAFAKLCVESIVKNSHFKHQIILFVNDGGDGTIEWLESQRDIDFLHAPSNVGICVALNSCRSLIKGDYVVFMNDDMYVCPGWDLELSRAISEIGHDRFMLSSTLIEPRPVNNSSYVSIVKDFGDTVSSFREEDLLRSYKTLEKKDWSGSSWPPSVVSRRVWDIVGGYSIEFSPGMYSDPDFSMKLWKYGVRIFKGIGASKVYHFQSKSTTKIKKNDGSKTFLMKWGMTARTFYRYYLRMGESVSSPLPDEPVLPRGTRMKSRLKKILKSF